MLDVPGSQGIISGLDGCFILPVTRYKHFDMNLGKSLNYRSILAR